jgi:TetR/AcrR family transcriptional repressor of mexJK operon
VSTTTLEAAASRDAQLTPDPKEAKIVAAAHAEFLEHGYAGTSMDSIAGRARVSKTTLYTRFSSKDALFAAVIAAECGRHGMRFRPEEFRGLPVEEALFRIGRRFVDLITSHEAVLAHRIVTAEASRFPEVAQAFFDAGPVQGRRTVAAYLADAAERGELELDDPEFAASQLLMGLKGTCVAEVEFGVADVPPPAERDAHVRRVVRFFLDGARPRGIAV